MDEYFGGSQPYHQFFNGNYGIYFTIRDRLMGTLRPDYDLAYDELKKRNKNS
jgi:sterol desaturase/sphingolipid hydroxylase (fatty acid hydroxylase superfamily)